MTNRQRRDAMIAKVKKNRKYLKIGNTIIGFILLLSAVAQLVSKNYGAAGATFCSVVWLAMYEDECQRHANLLEVSLTLATHVDEYFGMLEENPRAEEQERMMKESEEED